jgi:CzcA family heavy metal efflux pump
VRPPRGPVGQALDATFCAIVRFCLKFPYIVVAISIAVCVWGVVALRDNPTDVFPDFAPPQIQIQTESLGLSTSDVESLVTVPLEQGLNGTPGLTDMRSTSVPQLSSILMIFAPGTDLIRARQLVQERLKTVQPTLPKWASPPVMLPPVSATARALQIGMWSDTYTIPQLSQLMTWRIKPRLMQIDGVADVSVWNERQPTLQVQVDPAKMAAHGVTLDNVERTTSDALDSGALQFSTGSVVGAGGFLDGLSERLQVVHKLAINTPADLAEVPLQDQPGLASAEQPAAKKQAKTPVASPKSTLLTLGDVAHVVEDHQPIIGDAVINGRPGLLLVIEKLPWGNTLDVTKNVDQVLKDMQPGLQGVHFDATIFRPANFVNDSLHNLVESMLIGFVLVGIVLILFLFEWRTAFVALVTIPLSMAGAFVLLHQAGLATTTMVLAGFSIALGDNVDDSIIDVENILRRLREERAAGGTRPIEDVMLEASVEVRDAMVFSTLIDVSAVMPVFLLVGLTAAFFQPLVLSYALTILVSMVISLTTVPATTLLLLRNVPVERHRSPLTEWLRNGYSAVLSKIVARPAGVYAGAAVLLLAGALVLPHLGQSLFPQFKQRDLLIHWDAIPGTSDAEVVRMTNALQKRLMAIPGVRNFGAHIGRSIGGEEVVGVNAAEVWISIDPKVDYDKTVAAVRRVVGGYPGLYRDVQTYLNERIEEVLAGSTEAVVVRVYGSDLDQLRAKASEVLDRVSDVPGVIDQHVDLSVDTPQMEVEVDVPKAARYGLKPGDVRRQAAALVAGMEMGNVFHDNLVQGVIMWSTPASRDSVSAVNSAMLDAPTGGRVRLGDIARVSMNSDPYLVKRDKGLRYIDVTTNVQGRDLGSVVHDIEQQVKEITFPAGSHFEMLGEYNERQAAQSRLWSTALIALVVIAFLLRFAFDSWRRAALLFVTLPAALVGGIFAVYIGGGVITIGALVGLFTVFGLAQRNGILMINHCDHLEWEEGETFGPQMVVRGARERLAPILMTSLCIGLGLLPLVFGGDKPGHEIEYPLAVVIIGGLTTSTLMTLFVLPSVYLRFGRGKKELEQLTDEVVADSAQTM